MTDASAALPQQQFRVFSVFGRSFTVLFRNIVPFGVLSLALTLPYVLWDYLTSTVGGGSAVWPGIVGTIINLTFGYLLTAALTFGTIRDLRGNGATVGECLQYGLPLIGKVLGLALLYGLLVWLGLIAFVIPGIVVMVVYWVLIPVAVIEQETIGGSFRRASYLSAGSRWRIFGLFILFVICFALLMGVVIGTATTAAMDGTGVGIGTSLLTWLVTALLGAFGSTLYAVSYHDLRVAKEGVDINQIAAVFD